ncbi:hypothetical protein GDO81_014577 [Engystomops pustulosus]|uniref:Uncharacterized protein n=1 Tax=Engystomops pustulosus TaxID=76066 RepID=A0AAV7BBK3_ENGPU|nr:hypothetical protein GDO81_014577 [Engystomops pustulosus]
MAAADLMDGAVGWFGEILGGQERGSLNSRRSFLGHCEDGFDPLVFYHHYRERHTVRYNIRAYRILDPVTLPIRPNMTPKRTVRCLFHVTGCQ